MKKKSQGAVRGWGWVGWEGQCGCEIEVIVKMKKESGEFRSGVGGCERRIEDIVKMKKKVGGMEEVRVDVNTKN